MVTPEPSAGPAPAQPAPDVPATDVPAPDGTQRPLPGDDPAIRRRLPARIVWYWRLRGLLIGLPALGVAILALVFWVRIDPVVRWSAVGIVALGVLYEVLAGAPLRWRFFWYAVSFDEIDIESGVFVRTRTLVPISRVQHLRTERGPLADLFRVATVHIHTAAGTVPISGLDRAEAADVRARIGALARLSDDDV